MSDGGQITYLQIVIVGYPTELQVVQMCKPQGLPQMTIRPGCAKGNGGTNVIYAMHVTRNGDQVVNHYFVLTQWGHELWHLSGGRHWFAASRSTFCALLVMSRFFRE